MEWGRNGGYWQGQAKNAAGRTVGQTSPISVFPGTNGAPPRASVTVALNPAETQDLKRRAGDGSKPEAKPTVEPKPEAKPEQQPAPQPDQTSRSCEVQINPPATDQERRLVEETTRKAQATSTPGNAEYLSNSVRGPVLTGVMDKQTGEIFYGTNNKGQNIPRDLHPLLRDRLKKLQEAIGRGEFKPGETCGLPGWHSEIYALDQALKAREARLGRPLTEADLSEMLLHNRSIMSRDRGGSIP